MELDFDKYCLVDRSPTTVLPSPRPRTKVANRKSSEKPEFRKNIASLNKEFPEINFSQHHIALCGDARLKKVGNKVLRRTEAAVERKKIEFSRGSSSAFSFGIIDSLCSSDEDSSIVEPNRSSLMSLLEQSSNSSINENDMAANSHKSLSTKLDLPHSPSSKSRFTPMKKIFDPFVKSKSRKSPLSSSNESDRETISGPRHVKQNYCGEEKENHYLALNSSPAHLHGLLKLRNKHFVPFFEFSVNSPDDVYTAKTWKVENDLTWIYTFHSLHRGRKSNTMVGQMHFSCRLCKEAEKDDKELNDSMVTEFVLYDTIHSRKNTSSELEIAAMITQVPFESSESLKLKVGDKKIDENLHDHCQFGKAEEGISDNSRPVKMHVVIPAGNHSSPTNESGGGPSRLLNRWRLGGGCDCGGWDMACPLQVFSHRKNVKIADLTENIRNPFELFVQGKKENIPAFTMRAVGDEKYAVDFHAQLSSLQAFSISVAILQAAEASTVVGRDISRHMSQIDSLNVFANEELENTADTIAEGEISKVNKMEQVLPSFILNPPFSPIARV